MHYRSGLGFNPKLITGELPLPTQCQYIEAGTNLFNHPTALQLFQNQELSLHLARVPFCESVEIQQSFIEHLKNSLTPEVSTIGLHLCGSYQQGLGLLGLGSDFQYSDDAVQASQRFLELLSQAIDRPILIENANFYDRTPQQAIQTLHFANQLCRDYGASLILDLAHLIMNAHNLGLDPYYLLGQVDLTQVSVIHLSGIVEGRDGVFHDGHSRGVHPLVWEMLQTVLRLLTGLSNRSITFVLEHSDPNWSENLDRFANDWECLQQQIQIQPEWKCPQEINLEKIGIGYLANIIFPRYFPEIYAALEPTQFAELVRQWGADFVQRIRMQPKQYVSISPIGYLSQVEVTDILNDFQRFLQQY